MLKRGQKYYCETKEDVDLIMSLLEKKNYTWASGAAPRSQYQNAPIVYYIDSSKDFTCDVTPSGYLINESTPVSNIRNKIISELRR